MPSVHDTAYPRLKAAVTARDLAEVYTPTPAEQVLAATVAPHGTSQVGFLIVFKTFQRLGYFVPVQAVPQPIVDHIATHVGTIMSSQEVHAYDASGTRRRHMVAIRRHLAVHPYDHATQQLLETVLREAAQTKDDLVDLMNIGIEELIRQRYELPGFTTLRRTAQRARAEINRALFQQVATALGSRGHADRGPAPPGRRGHASSAVEPTQSGSRTAHPDAVARPSRSAPLAHALERGCAGVRHRPGGQGAPICYGGSEPGCGAHATAGPAKRATLAAALVKTQVAQTLDDLGEMFIKRMRRIHHKGPGGS